MTLDSILISVGERSRQTKRILNKAFPIVAAAQMGWHMVDKYVEIKTGFGFVDYFSKPLEMQPLTELARVLSGLPFIYIASRLNNLANDELNKAHKDNKLAQQGIYRYSRNPLYDGDRAAAIGLTVVSPSFLTLTMAAGIYALTELAARGEERKLKRDHGDEFLTYQKRVPRFLIGNLLPKYWMPRT